MATKLNFVVSGGNGYIGSHMCKYLHSLGHNIHIFDNHCTSPKHQVHSYGQFYNLDIGDKAAVAKALQKIGSVDAVFHFAARALVGESEEIPFFYYQENFVKTLHFCEVIIENQIKNFIFSSTCATFGIPDTATISESNPQNPINAYGASKKMVEVLLRDLGRKNLLNVSVLRYFNAAGCSPDAEIGENHDPETHLIPNLILAHLAGKQNSFKLFGNQYPTPDGSCVRDYIHVLDLAEAHYLAFEFVKKQKGFHDFNLGSGLGYSVLDVKKEFEAIIQKDLPMEVYPPRPGDPAYLVANSQKALANLNWKTKYTLADCISHSLKYLSRKAKENV